MSQNKQKIIFITLFVLTMVSLPFILAFVFWLNEKFPK